MRRAACVLIALWATAAFAVQRRATLLTGRMDGQVVDVLIVHREGEVIGAIFRQDHFQSEADAYEAVHLLTGTRTSNGLALREWSADGRPVGRIRISGLKRNTFNASPLTNTLRTQWHVLDRLHSSMKAGAWERALLDARLACALSETECRWLEMARERRVPSFAEAENQCTRYFNNRLACAFYLDDATRLAKPARTEMLGKTCASLLLGCEEHWGQDEVALIHAAAAGDFGGVEAILRASPQVDVNAGGGALQTALESAILARSEPIVRMLLDHGADPNHSSSEFNRPLGNAIANHRMDAISRLLIDHGATDNGALWEVAGYGQYEFAEKLIANGMDANDSVPAGTALMNAVASGDVKMVNLLLRHGADPDAETKYSGGSAITLAQKQGRDEILQLLLQHEKRPHKP